MLMDLAEKAVRLAIDLGAEYTDDFKQVGWEENFSLIHILTYSKKVL